MESMDDLGWTNPDRNIFVFFPPNGRTVQLRYFTVIDAVQVSLTVHAEPKMDTVNVGELVERLGSEHDGARKKAAFGLQSYIGDPSFADVFIAEGGLVKLRMLALTANGNTLAYSLASLAKLLEVDKGWDHVSQALVERVSAASIYARRSPAPRMPDETTDHR